MEAQVAALSIVHNIVATLCRKPQICDPENGSTFLPPNHKHPFRGCDIDQLLSVLLSAVHLCTGQTHGCCHLTDDEVRAGAPTGKQGARRGPRTCQQWVRGCADILGVRRQQHTLIEPASFNQINIALVIKYLYLLLFFLLCTPDPSTFNQSDTEDIYPSLEEEIIAQQKPDRLTGLFLLVLKETLLWARPAKEAQSFSPDPTYKPQLKLLTKQR